MTGSPTTLASLARCLTCITPAQMKSVRNSVLNQIAFAGLAPNLILPGSKYAGIGVEFDVTVQANTTYLIVWGSNELSMTLCGVNYPSPGAGQRTTVFTGSCTVMQFFGTFAGTTVTARVEKTNPAVNPPVPTGLTFLMNTGATQATATWNAPPAGVTSTEVWTSSDNVTYTLAATVNAPGTSAVVTMPAPTSAGNFWAKLRANVTGKGSSGFTTAVGCYDAVTSAWALQVITNGGTAMAAATIGGVDEFVRGLKATTVWAKMIIVNVFANEPNINAALTALIQPAGGRQPWTMTPSQANPAWTPNGWVANNGGNFKTLQTGIIMNATAVTNANAGSSIYVYNNPNFIGTNADGGCGQAPGPPYMEYTTCSQLHAHAYLWDNNNIDWTTFDNSTLPGFYSFSRVATNDFRMYFANSLNAFSQVGQNLTNTVTNPPNTEMYFAGANAVGGTHTSNKTISFQALHLGLSSSETQTLYNAVQTLRTRFGGGFR